MTHQPEYQLLRLLTFINPTEMEQEHIVDVLQKVSDWDNWLRTGQFNKVLPICYHSLRQLSLIYLLPPFVASHIENEAQKISTQNELRNMEAAQFLREFVNAGIPVALLKGVAFGEFVYHNPAYKRMNDIDILVKKEDIDTIYTIYDQLRYFYIGERISGSKAKSDKVSHLAPPFVSPNYNCVIGTQWGIKSPYSPYKIDYQKIWSHSLPFTFQGVPVNILSPEDNLHHLCLHLGYFKISLRDMMDFYNLLRITGPSFDWEYFYNTVKDAKTENPVYFGLALSQYVYEVPEAENFLERISSSVHPRYKRAVKWKTRTMMVFLHLHSDHIQTIEKAISEFDSTSYFPEKFILFCRMWGLIWFPPKEEVIRMKALYKPQKWETFQARLTIPFTILKVIAQEIGYPILFLLMGKTIMDLAIALVKLPFVKKSKCDTHAYASKVGIPLENLLKIKESFQ